MMRKRLIVYGVIIISMLVFSKYLAVNVQSSLPIGIYVIIPAKEVKKNEYVIILS